MDVLSASFFDGKVAWYENTGNGTFGAQRVLTAGDSVPHSIDAADLDGDGDLDVLSGSTCPGGNGCNTGSGIGWHENLGGGAFGPLRVITAAAGSVRAADLDGDGDVDVLSISSAEIDWYENQGGGVFASPQAIASGLYSGHSLHATDLDGDGDADVLAAGGFSLLGGSTGFAQWQENLGGGQFGSPHVLVNGIDHTSIHAADVDGDGDGDILTATSGLGIRWHENLGAGTFGPPLPITATGVFEQSLHATDLDGDGDVDVLAAAIFDDTIAWYENLGAGTFERHVVTTATDGPSSVQAADLDGDGDADVLSTFFDDDKIAWYENQLGASVPACAGLSNFGVGFANDASADGRVVVGDLTQITGAPSAFRWTSAGGVQALDLGALSGGDSSARAVSRDGSVVVGTAFGLFQSDAFRWSASTGAQPLAIAGSSSASDVSADGSVVVGSAAPSQTADWYPFRWTAAGGAQALGTLGGAEAWATGVSDDGRVVVGTSQTAGGELRAFRWTASGGMEDLGSLGGDSGASAVSGDGEVVVGTSSGVAFRWTASDGIQGLGTLPGATHSRALGVNADGSVVVGDSGLQAPSAFRWTASEGMRPVASGLVGADLVSARAVNADGSVVVGGSPAFRLRSSVLGETYCRPTVANSTGCGGIVLAEGDTRLATGSLELTASLLPQDSFGFFLTSQTQDLVVNAGGSQGTLCLGGAIGRFVGPGQVMDSGASGSFSLAVDLGALPAPTITGTRAVQPGETWNFQCWYRDENPAATSNFTDAVSLTFQ